MQYKTAFVLAHELRESLLDEEDDLLLGDVEMDSAYFNGQVRPANTLITAWIAARRKTKT